MVDHLTGWPMAKTIPDKAGATVANAIYEKLILEHTCPQILLCDNGKEFTNDQLSYICEQHNIEHHFTSLYMPSCSLFDDKDSRYKIKWEDRKFQSYLESFN